MSAEFAAVVMVTVTFVEFAPGVTEDEDKLQAA